MASYEEKKTSSAFYGSNAGYLEQLAADFAEDPARLTPQWRSFFTNGGGELASAPAVPAAAALTHASASPSLKLARLIESYRLLGNRIATIDPLAIDERPMHPSLRMEAHGFSDADLDKVYSTDIPGLPEAPLRKIVATLQQAYCGNISAEFMYITDPVQRNWFIEKYESLYGDPGCSKDEKLHLLERMIAADGLEKFLNTKFTGQKRFSLEGGDALIPLLDVVLRRACENGCGETCIGMAHRGRLNVLINILGKNPKVLFEEFEGKVKLGRNSSGDVKYHMGFSSNMVHAGNEMHIALAFNPSHLEIVNPVVEGSVWARQQRRGANGGKEVLPILIHGDAALAGQGIGMEVLNMSQTRGYATAGTIHITVNNQVGFTISHINDARSTYWCTDLAKMAECPVLHVNGNDPEAVALAGKLALEYRDTFHQDVFIDLCCYRRHGHNEQDEPRVTQPYMYSLISKLPTPASVYANQLSAAGVIDASDEAKMRGAYEAKLKANKSANPIVKEANKSNFIDWSAYVAAKNKWTTKFNTGISARSFKRLGELLSTVPAGFSVHKRVAKVIADRAKMGAGEARVDWGMAENLAYASLLEQGYGVRLSGQDVGRGTFFHRHAVWHDQNRSGREGHTYVPLAQLASAKTPVHVVDSLLSESAVLGFEYGVSLTSPKILTVWEAQFGDFANNAQVVIDQFIASGEFKWGRVSGLVMLLPHGYEGQGPEHSSGRLERYLQLCAEYNLFICVPTTAAQIFHLLRRQMINPLRRPLVVMTPKSLLRHKDVASDRSLFLKSVFKPVITETDARIERGRVRRVIACSGKIYYDLIEQRAARKIDDIAIVRLEQIYPFPHQQFKAELRKFPKCTEVLWCQEEPGNQGAWLRIQHYLGRHLSSGQGLSSSMRPSSASTATGLPSVHRKQQQEVIDGALAR